MSDLMAAQTPVAAVGIVLVHEQRVLLVRRSRPPNAGLWAIPGGKIRLGETLQQAAEREMLEETGLVVKAGEPIYAFDLIEAGAEGVRFHYVIVDVRARYVSGALCARDDALDAKWFTPAQAQEPQVEQRTRALLSRWMDAGFQ